MGAAFLAGLATGFWKTPEEIIALRSSEKVFHPQMDPGRREQIAAEFRRRLRTKAPLFLVSAATGEGCRELVYAVARYLSEHGGKAES
jgi:hypothetical protein